MNGLTFMVLILVGMLLVTTYVKVEPVYAQFDFNAYLGNSILDEEIDGIIGSEWDDAGNHPEISIDPQGIAEIWTKNDGSFLYIAMNFTADSSNPWVGFQFERTTHMSSGADGAIFGNDNIGANKYRDISFGGFGIISTDSIQNGIGAIQVGESNLVTVELKKPLNSGDSAGNDIEWGAGNTYTLIIRWDSNGQGSSGGNTNHLGGSLEDKTILINVDEIPEFSGLTLLVALVAFAVIVIVLKRQSSLQISKNI
jgi:hypothetical protein